MAVIHLRKAETEGGEVVRFPNSNLGRTIVCPSTRIVSGPGGSVSIEPRVMQVLLELVGAQGAVVTRDQLAARCWRGTTVGDDAINRTIAAIRKAARTISSDSLGVETISKSGYRLTGSVVVEDSPDQDRGTAVASEAPERTKPVTRRLLIGTGLVVTASAALWRFWPDGNARQAGELVDAAQRALRDELPASGTESVGLLRKALDLRPGDPAILGGLAVAWYAASEFAEPSAKASAVVASEDAARRALAIEPNQPDSLAALALLQPEFGDWLAAEKRLRAVLAIQPSNETALSALAALLQGVGRSREAAAIVLPLNLRFPLAPKYLYRRTYSLWNLGRLGEADRSADNAMELVPRHPSIWFAKFWLFSMTGRPAIALAMLDDIAGYPPSLTPADAADLRVSIIALSTKAEQDVAAAVKTTLASIAKTPSWAIFAILILSQLGQMDTLFDVARGYLLRRGPHTGPLRPSGTQPGIRDERHRKTLMLFIGATQPMRDDPRFLPLCEEMGMAAYWHAAGVTPDFLAARAHRVGA
ncbi:winged helix-turn-helix domain-containing protein [Sphingomonas sp. JC676]|uniref:winged helix-turn-helix domain-containing protein n=1 Tax=Sphingomonas sp. JC676 TaxID=2768065 RepID=UPI001657D5EB|nr:winged helix-turn-helix domain-containing protein [Sphingomonas sp. JC676]MBC9030834.1 winged helix-turn-helix domain-containing protein [Sphingomonas sp. JC676]